MREDGDFNATILIGCVIGTIVGYHKGGLVFAVDDAFVGLLISAISAALLAEVAYAAGKVSAHAEWLLNRTFPFITLVLLIAIAHRYW